MNPKLAALGDASFPTLPTSARTGGAMAYRPSVRIISLQRREMVSSATDLVRRMTEKEMFKTIGEAESVAALVTRKMEWLYPEMMGDFYPGFEVVSNTSVDAILADEARMRRIHEERKEEEARRRRRDEELRAQRARDLRRIAEATPVVRRVEVVREDDLTDTVKGAAALAGLGILAAGVSAWKDGHDRRKAERARRGTK